MQQKQKRTKDIAVDSFLITAELSPNTHKAIQAAGTLVKEVRGILSGTAYPLS